MLLSREDPQNKTRAGRLAQTKRGPGVFVYQGGAMDHEYVPTVLLTSGKSPLFNADGIPVMDGSGRPMFERRGQVIRNENGEPMLGGPPKIATREIEEYTLRGVTFGVGQKILVKDASLALKLRGMRYFEEVEGQPDVVQEDEKPRRGRPRKGDE